MRPDVRGYIDKVRLAKWKTEPCGHDANDDVGPAIEPYDLVHHLRIGVKSLPPHVIAEDHYVAFPWLVFGGQKRPAQQGPFAENTKEVVRTLSDIQILGLLAYRQRHAPIVFVSGKCFKRRSKMADLEICGPREGLVGTRAGAGLNVNDAVLVVVP